MVPVGWPVTEMEAGSMNLDEPPDAQRQRGTMNPHCEEAAYLLTVEEEGEGKVTTAGDLG